MTLSQILAVILLLSVFGVDKPTTDNIQAILLATMPSATTTVLTTPTLQPVPQTPQQTLSSPTVPAIITSMTPYKLVYEAGMTDFYYAGDKALQSATVNGQDATIVLNKYTNDCYMIDGQKTCGYYIARFTAPRTDESDQIVLTAEDGSTYTGTATTIN